MNPNELAHKVTTLTERVPIYIPLAKAALWVTATVLTLLVLLAVKHFLLGTRTDPNAVALASMVVQACQVLSLITLAVLGYRGGRRA